MTWRMPGRRGTASQTAQGRLADVRSELNSAHNPARRIGQALCYHGAALADLREQLRGVAEGAAKSWYVVDLASGTVTPVLERHGDPAAATAGAQQMADTLTAVLERARALDDSITNAITVNLPQPGTGFGRLGLPPVTRDTLAAQRGHSPADVNAWWSGLAPEQQEQAIRDHPDLVGWLDGVPATDRDAA